MQLAHRLLKTSLAVAMSYLKPVPKCRNYVTSVPDANLLARTRAAGKHQPVEFRHSHNLGLHLH
jgi:hypothetical protein